MTDEVNAPPPELRGTINPFADSPSAQDILAQLAAAVNLPSTASIHNPRHGNSVPYNFMALDRRTEISEPNMAATAARQFPRDRLEAMIRALNGDRQFSGGISNYNVMNNFRDLLSLLGRTNATLGDRESQYIEDRRQEDAPNIPRSSSTGP